MRAILFPGQGSQYVGMGADFYENFETTKEIFKTVWFVIQVMSQQ